MLQLQSILVYTLLAIFMFAFAKKANGSSRIYNYVPIILFTLVFGLRYSVGVDWDNYRVIYEEELYGLSLPKMIETRYEIGFILITYLCHCLHLPTYMLFVIIAAIQVFLIYTSLKEEQGVLPYIYLTFIFTGIAIQGFCNVMRQDVAFCIFLYALTFAKDRRLLVYIILCLLAFCFHKSAIILLPIYFIWSRRSDIFRSQILQCCIFIACIIMSFFDPITQILNQTTEIIAMIGYDDYNEYVMDLTTNRVFGPTRLMIILANLLIIFSSKDIKSYYNSELLNRMYDLYFVGLCCYFLFLGNMLFGRITLYFSNFMFIIYGYALCYFLKAPKTSVIFLKSSIISLMLFVTFASLIHNCTTNTDAYVTYFQEELHFLKDQQRMKLFSNQ